MRFLQTIPLWLTNTLMPYGGVGLMLLAICDSSFMSLPEVNDILLMTFSINNPSRMLVYASFTTLGSVIGCLLLYFIGRAGGEALLRKRFTDERLLKVEGWYKRHGVLAVIVPSLLPPPTPFKIFVFSAGTFGISCPRFIFAVVVGRGIRYFSEAFLAVYYGPAAIAFVEQNFGKIGMALAAVIVAAAFLFYIRRRARSIEA